MSRSWTIVRYGLSEAVRRKVFVVVLVLTAIFLLLFWLACRHVFNDLSGINPPDNIQVDPRTFAGTFLLGLSMFATLFLGTVLTVFLTLNVVSGDAERGLLQPLVVRPVGRSVLLLSRFAGAAAVSATYALVLFFIALGIVRATGSWAPQSIVTPALELAGAVILVTAVAVLGSVLFRGTANGIAVFMLFGGGLVAGLLGSIAQVLHSSAIRDAAKIASYVLPFEALYQDGLREITAGASGLTGFVLRLGPFGGGYVHGWPVRLWAAAYLVLVGGIAVWAFSRRDL